MNAGRHFPVEIDLCQREQGCATQGLEDDHGGAGFPRLHPLLSLNKASTFVTA